MTCEMQKQTSFSWVVSEHLVKILQIRNNNTANPKPKLLSTVKLPILADVPSRLRGSLIMLVLHF